MQLVANRNTNGHSNGKVFIDRGSSLDELSNKDYEYYEFNLNGKTLSKWNLNEDLVQSTGFTLDSLLITDA